MSEPAIFVEPLYRDAELVLMNLDFDGLLDVVRQAHEEGGYVSRNDVKGWRLIATPMISS